MTLRRLFQCPQLHKTARDAPGAPPADLLMTPEDLGLGEDLTDKLRAMVAGEYAPVRPFSRALFAVMHAPVLDDAMV